MSETETETEGYYLDDIEIKLMERIKINLSTDITTKSMSDKSVMGTNVKFQPVEISLKFQLFDGDIDLLELRDSGVKMTLELDDIYEDMMFKSLVKDKVDARHSITYEAVLIEVLTIKTETVDKENIAITKTSNGETLPSATRKAPNKKRKIVRPETKKGLPDSDTKGARTRTPSNPVINTPTKPVANSPAAVERRKSWVKGLIS